MSQQNSIQGDPSSVLRHKRGAPSDNSEDASSTKRPAIEAAPVARAEPPSQAPSSESQPPAAPSTPPAVATEYRRRDQETIWSLDLGDEEYESLRAAPQSAAAGLILMAVVRQVIEDNKDSLDIENIQGIRLGKLMGAHPAIGRVAAECLFAGSFDGLRQLEVLGRADPSPPELEEQAKSQQVTEMCWKADYRGSAAAVFTRYLRRLARASSVLPLARTFVIVQSSGMGKSRMVDEVAKTVITVPMNFRSDDIDKGYPPPDSRLRQWLLGLSGIEDPEGRPDSKTRKDRVITRCEAFVESLLTTLLSHLEGVSAEASGRVWRMSLGDLAQRFREKMEEDQSFKGHGRYRETFYEQVISGANKITESTTPSHASAFSSTVTEVMPPLSGSRKCNEGATLKGAAERLVDALKDRVLRKLRDDEQLIVLLAFDGSHESKDFPRTRSDGDPGWSLYSELRGALRQLVSYPIFSVFLPSTPECFSSPKLPTEFDPSNRIQMSGLRVLIPYSELGFDNLAIRVADDGALRLDDVACLKHMCSLGRPLFATRYLCGDENIKAAIVDFAVDQLLAMRTSRRGTMLSQSQELACLAVRLPLEFTLDSALSSTQVERHMRVCLSAEPGEGLQGLLTVASSEPLLAEASMRAFNLS
ncbi:hypothetical protein BC834DRAFT_503549 [Gloeopeniophorella convolvens]|nr:hypothetical protein BC834DRAFT_503549 [Gloeopeniophorella convolvens]